MYYYLDDEILNLQVAISYGIDHSKENLTRTGPSKGCFKAGVAYLNSLIIYLCYFTGCYLKRFCLRVIRLLFMSLDV